MELVADSSAFLAVVLVERQRSAILDATRSAQLCAPEILPYEVGNALAAMVRRSRLDRQQALEAWDSFVRIPVKLHACAVKAALELATRRGIYAYDAYFLHTARRHGYPLLTLDRGMLNAARELGINTLEIDPLEIDR
jgi:predicted nucleic acid-binding protein